MMSDRETLTRQFTAFRSFQSLIDAPGYWPSLRRSQPGAVRLASFYDAAQRDRGDKRRAYVS